VPPFSFVVYTVRRSKGGTIIRMKENLQPKQTAELTSKEEFARRKKLQLEKKAQGKVPPELEGQEKFDLAWLGIEPAIVDEYTPMQLHNIAKRHVDENPSLRADGERKRESVEKYSDFVLRAILAHFDKNPNARDAGFMYAVAKRYMDGPTHEAGQK